MQTLYAIGRKMGAEVEPPNYRWIYEVYLNSQGTDSGEPEDEMTDAEANLTNF